MKIILDAMGGDNAPLAPVEAAALAASALDTDVVLVGRGEEILKAMTQLGMSDIPQRVEITNANDVIDMHEDPTNAIRTKRNSSMVVALNMLKDGEGKALVSAGSTGALLTGATLIVKRIKGIRRAALAPTLPSAAGTRIIIDSGANIECTPEMLLQFGELGYAYAKNVMEKASPKVGLLNIGEEDTKGTPLHKSAYALLKECKSINFIGNVEARDVFLRDVDVIVCDGFSGNVLLKSLEGMGLYMSKLLKEILTKNARTKLAAAMVKKDILAMRRQMDYAEVGGSILLGVQKPVIKAHGSSDARALFNAIGQAVKCANSGFINDINIFGGTNSDD
ncbi:MAG: phosphate acyltransferase PlsX [Oscillospiraceae bacterium]|jgi:glycerol-3-phosphate acyltransferase PlsX|nr:phosphate acyltransferase PlsX [Oscillospiraceae bacterium]